MKCRPLQQISSNIFEAFADLGPGVLSTKRSVGMCHKRWVAKSASWFINDPLFYANFGMCYFEWVNFSKFQKIGSNLRKVEKIVGSSQNLA